MSDDGLFEVEPDWKEHWQGMPDYRHDDLAPDSTLLVHFKSPEDRAAFAKLVDQTLSAKTKFIWHPKQDRNVLFDKRHSTAEKVNPRYPVYVISKGRWESRWTSKALERMDVPYHIVVEPQELEQYASVIDRRKILVTPFSNLGQGSIPARNFVWDHALTTGAERHWILDDNIKWFGRFHENKKIEVDSGVTFRAVEDFCDRYDNVVMAGFNYDYFVPHRQGANIKPVVLNTRIYSAILLKNDLAHRWRGRYNEDTDLSLRLLKDGLCTALFNAFPCYKGRTLTMKGGNTDQLYAGVNATADLWRAHATACQEGCRPEENPRCQAGRDILSKDGRWLMAESLREQHPDVTTVEWKWDRWQHQVDYRYFQRNAPRLKAGIVVNDGADNYGMELTEVGQEEKPAVVAPEAPKPSVFDLLQATEKPATTLEPPAQENPNPSVLESFLAGPGRSAERLLADLEAKGHKLAALDGRLLVGNASSLSDIDRAAIKEQKAKLVALLTPPPQTVVEFVGHASSPDASWRPDDPPERLPDEIVLNFATTGLDWHKGDRPVGLTVASLDGSLVRFLPFGFRHGGNLDESQVKRWAQTVLRGKRIVNSKTKFDVHHAREWGVDLEAQGCTFSDVQHTAALLDDHRKRFGLDFLAADYLPNEPVIKRVDESRHDDHHASEVAERERHTALLVAKLTAVMQPEIDKQELRAVHDLEDRVIPCVVEMEKNGAPIDVDLLNQYGAECSRRHDELMWGIARECGFAFEHTAKGWTRLLESLKLTVPEAFDEESLNEIDHPLVRKGQRASQHASLNSKIFKAYPEHVVDGVLRYEINQLASDDGGTVSGRFSIGLVQQVPNPYNHGAAFGDDLFPRRLFTAKEGQFLEADAEQIEFRLLVHYSRNQRLLDAYKRDPRMSFHKQMHAMLMGYKPDIVYSHVKNYNFAAQYGAKSIKLATMMGFITKKEGEEIRRARRWDDPRLKLIKEIEAAYAQAHPEASELLDRASHMAKPSCDEYCRPGDALHKQWPHRGFVKTFLGRRSRFPTNYKTYIGLNRILQGTGADVMKAKLVKLHDARKETGFTLRITNHDAVLGDATTDETRQKVAEILDRQSFAFRVPILWAVGVGRTWADCKG